MAKYAFAIYTDPDIKSEAVKAEHALHYALALKAKGHDVIIYFDGLGTKVPISSSPLLKPFVEQAIKAGIVYGACGYCASPGHAGTRDKLLEIKEIKLIGNENDHKDLSIFNDMGYEVIIV